eukprot:gene25079-42732_t
MQQMQQRIMEERAAESRANQDLQRLVKNLEGELTRADSD